MATEHTASSYQNDKLMRYQMHRSYSEICSVLSVAFAFFSFLSSLCPVHVHQRPYTKRLNFCEQNLQILHERPCMVNNTN
jgi:hypothetical protein